MHACIQGWLSELQHVCTHARTSLQVGGVDQHVHMCTYHVSLSLSVAYGGLTNLSVIYRFPKDGLFALGVGWGGERTLGPCKGRLVSSGPESFLPLPTASD